MGVYLCQSFDASRTPRPYEASKLQVPAQHTKHILLRMSGDKSRHPRSRNSLAIVGRCSVTQPSSALERIRVRHWSRTRMSRFEKRKHASFTCDLHGYAQMHGIANARSGRTCRIVMVQHSTCGACLRTPWSLSSLLSRQCGSFGVRVAAFVSEKGLAASPTHS